MEVLKDTDNDLFLRIIKEPVGKVFNFNIKAKADSYQDQMKVRYQVMRFVKVDWVEGAKDMLAQIAAY
jgi:replication factor A1